MMRLSTLFWIGLGIALIFGVFHLKREVHALEEDLTRLSRNILAEQEAIQVLQAEWSYLNQPARLRELAKRHLDLQPMKPTQFSRIGDLPLRPAEAQAPLPPAPPAAGSAPKTRARTAAAPTPAQPANQPAARPAAKPPTRGPAGGDAMAAGHQTQGTR